MIIDILVFICYFLLAGAVVFLSIKISDYVDTLDKTTKVSGAFIGGVVLAAVTSLPELFTSISSIFFLNENELVLGNILGSNVFNLCILGIAFLFLYHKIRESKIARFNLLSAIAIAIDYALVIVAIAFNNSLMLGWMNGISILLILVYLGVIKLTPSTDKKEKDAVVTTTLTTKQIIIRFIIASVLLVGASIAITYATDYIAGVLHLGKTTAGALFLGIATSLPELTATISLCLKGNLNAGLSDIFGSCIFNFFILALADIFSFQSGNTLIYIASGQSFSLAIFGVISCLIFTSIVAYKLLAKKHEGKMLEITARTLGALVIVSYVCSLIIA